MASTGYLQGHTDSVIKSHSSRKASNTCGYFLDRLQPHFDILDVGCGPGTITSSLADLIPQGRIIGVDYEEHVLDKAHNQPNLPANCSFQVASATSLPFPDETFDVVHTSQVLNHIPDVLGAMCECRRVCKTGGFLAIREADFPAFTIYPVNEGLRLWQRAMIETHTRGGCHAMAGRMLVRWALDVGFRLPDIAFSSASMVYAGENRKWWGEHMAARIGDDQVWRQKVVALEVGTEKDLELMQAGWREFVADEAAVFISPCGQIICVKRA